MVKEASRRKDKYQAKVEGDITKKRIDAQKESMIEREGQYLFEIASLERTVKNYLETMGFNTLAIRDYLNFMREIYALKNKFSQTTLNSEALLKVNKWVDRGLNQDVLVKIANMLGANPTPSEPTVQEVDVIDRTERLLGKIMNFPSSYPLPIDQIIDLQQIRALTKTTDSIESALAYYSATLGDGYPNAVKVLAEKGGSEVTAVLYPYMFNGSTWDRLRGSASKGVLVQSDREDLISLGGVASPNNVGVLIVQGTAGQKIKVYDAGFHAGADGLHYFYFGTTTTPTSKRFCTINKALPIHKTFRHPRVSGSGDNLYIFSSVSESNMPYDIAYITE